MTKADRTRANDERCANVVGFARGRDFRTRRAIEVELPEFLIALLECRVNEANEGASCEEHVTISHFVEYQVAGMLSIRDVAEIELEMPGFAAAVQDWLATASQ